MTIRFLQYYRGVLTREQPFTEGFELADTDARAEGVNFARLVEDGRAEVVPAAPPKPKRRKRKPKEADG